MLKIETFVVNHFQENTYLVYDDESKKALIIDPGAPDSKIDGRIGDLNLKLDAVVCTHAHPDHVFGAKHFCDHHRAPFYLHENEAPVLEAYDKWAPALGFQGNQVPKPSHFFKSGETLPLGKSELKILATPGHTPGGICFHCALQKLVFTGDTLFRQSIGRSDFPGGDGPLLIQSIKEHLLTLPPDTEALPGHGPRTNIGFEKSSNPFL